VPVEAKRRFSRPEPGQEMYRPPVEEPGLVNARMPSGEKKET
jgi:hypothetical protein